MTISQGLKLNLESRNKHFETSKFYLKDYEDFFEYDKDELKDEIKSFLSSNSFSISVTFFWVPEKASMAAFCDIEVGLEVD